MKFASLVSVAAALLFTFAVPAARAADPIPADGSVVASFAPSDIGTIVAATPDATGRILALTTTGLRRIGAAGTVEPTTSFGISVSGGAAILPLADGRILVGGSFSTQTHQPSATASSIPRLIRLNADATGTIDSSYTASLPSSVNVSALAPGASGKFYVGSIVTLSGTSGTLGLQRFLADGSPDPAFTPPAITGSTGNRFTIGAIRELSSTQVLVLYSFISSSAGGSTLDAVARYNVAATAPYAVTLDPSFGSAGRVVLNGPARGIDLLPDGRIAIAGPFTTVAGLGRAGVALLLPDGTVDPSFAFPVTLGGDPTGIVYRNGRLLVRGFFTTVGGVTQRNLARFNLDGAKDPSFAIGVGAAYGPSSSQINTALYTPSGDIFVGGRFDSFTGVPRNDSALLVGNPQIGAIGFAPPRVSVVESDNPLSLTLRRYGPATEAVSIAYATSPADGTTAVVDADYTATSGTVEWAAGDSSDKTISIPLLDDDLIDSSPTHSLRVLLSAPTGPVTAAASATITIIDDESPVAFGAQPTGAALTVGANLALSATTTSPSATTYQWFRNAVAIPAATTANFARTSVTLADAGIYTLVATNLAGSFTSTPVFVSVRPRPGRPAPGQATSGRPDFFSAGATPVTLVATLDGGALIGGDFPASPAKGINQAHLIRVRPDGATDTSFKLPVNGAVTALLRQPDGKILVGGAFTAITDDTANTTRLLRLDADFSLDTAFAANTDAFLSTGNVTDLALDSTGRIYVSLNGGSIHRYAPDGVRDPAYGPLAAGAISSLAAQADDRLLLAGAFTNVNAAVPAGNKFARLVPDGSTDNSFLNAISPSGVPTFNDLLVLADARILAAGRFLGNSSTATLVVVNSSGSLGGTFATGDPVTRIAEAPDGKILGIRTVIGIPGSTRVFRLLASGTNDTTFTIGNGPDADARALDVGPDGSVWLAGGFTTFDGTTTRGVAKLAGDPATPAILNPPVNFGVAPGGTARFGVGAYGTGLAYQWFKDGTPLANDGRISGATTPILSITDVTLDDDATYAVGVTAITLSGPVVALATAHLHVLDTPVIATEPVAPVGHVYLGTTLTLSPEVYAAAPATYVWRRDGQVLADGTRISGATTAALIITNLSASDTGIYTLTITNPQGTATTTPVSVIVTPRPDIRALSHITLAASRNVGALLPLPDGRMLIGGTGNTSFSGGTSSTSVSFAALVLVNPDGSLAPAGQPKIDLDSFTAQISALLRLPDGKILVGGNFTTIGGLARPRLARLNTDFTMDPTFDAALPPGGNGTIRALHRDPVGRLYVGGTFTSWGGVAQTTDGPARDYLVRLSADGALDPDFTTRFNHNIARLLPLPDGRLLVGGTFTLPRLYLAALDADGAFLPAFAPPIASAVSDLELNPAGDHFYAAGGSAGPYVHRFLLDGTHDPAFAGSVIQSGTVSDLAIQPDGKVIAYGFFNGGSAPPYHLVRLLPATGASDPVFTINTTNYGVGNGEGHLALDIAGRIWLGGAFTSTTFPGGNATRLLVLNGDQPALALDRQPLDRAVDLGATTTFTATTRATSAVTWQWFRDGVPLTNDGRITGATTASLVINGLLRSDAAVYTATATTLTAGPVTTHPARLTVLTEPEILTFPAVQTAELGSPFAATATTRGMSPLVHQWLRNGAPLPGQNTATLLLANPGLADTAYYQLRVSNSLGSATSAPVLFTFTQTAGGHSGLALPGFEEIPVNVVVPFADASFLIGGTFIGFTPPGASTYTPVRAFARITTASTHDPAYARLTATSSSVVALVRDSQGRTILAGNFTSINSGGLNTTRYCLARLTPAGALDSSWNTSFPFSFDRIACLAVDASDRVLVGGSFTSIPSIGTFTYALARLHATTGAVDGTFASPYTSGTVNTVRVLPDGRILAGGSTGLRLLESTGVPVEGFAYTGGAAVTAIHPLPGGDYLLGTTTGLQRVDANGTLLSPFPATGTGANGRVNAIVSLPDGRLVIGGGFTSYAGTPAGYLTIIHPDGTLATDGFTLGTGFNLTVNSLALDAADRLWVGGAFTTYRGAPAKRLVVLSTENHTPPTPAYPPVLVFADFLATADVPEGQRGPTDDPDADGVPNLLEFALGLDPLRADADGLPVIVELDGTLTLTYVRAEPAAILYDVETTNDLANPDSWTPAGVSQSTFTEGGITTATASVPLDGPGRFLLLRVTLVVP